MGIMTGREIFRDFVIDGVPASGPNPPNKRELRTWTNWWENMLTTNGPGLYFATLSALNGDLAHPANTAATVYNDTSFNGLYVKAGASGSGSWLRQGDLASSLVRLTVSGGTANAITASATESPQMPANKLYLFTPTANNTGAVTINGSPVKNALGSSLAANSFVTDIPVLMTWQTDHYQILVSVPVDATGVLNDVLAARDAAAASASALGNQVHQYDTRALAAAATIPTGVQAIKVTRYATGHQLSYATYIPGTSAGPGAFAEAGGHYWELDLSGGVVDPRWFGAKGDGINDDTTALQAALTRAIGGKELYIPLGTFGVSATLSGGAGNVRVRGESKTQSILKVLGSSALDPLLQFTDASDVMVDSVCFLGNSIVVGVGPIFFNVTAGSNVIGGYTVQNCTFKNFKAHYWMRFLTNVASTSHTRSMRYIRVLNNDWFSQTGNAPDFSNVGIPANMLDFQGSVDNSGSIIDDVIVSGNFADCTNVKCFAGAWAGARNVIIKDNFILNSGAAGVNDRGCYGIVVYNNHATANITFSPQDVTVCDNTIIAARSMGVYGATATRLFVLRNKISNVQDTTAASLPYAAISIGQCADSKVIDNDLVDNYVAIQLIPTPVSITAEASNNRIRSSLAAAKGVISLTLASFVNKIKIDSNTILIPDAAGVGISCNSGGAGFEFDTVDITRNRISVGDTAIQSVSNAGGGIRANLVNISYNDIEGPFDTIGIELDGAVAKTIVNGNTINMVNAASSALGFRCNSAANINIDGLKIMSRATGTALAFSASSAKGTMRNVGLIGVARANLPADGSGHMGFQAPSGVPAAGISAFVQNLSTTYYTPSGGYTVDGWVSDGTNWNAKKAAA